MLLTDWQIKSAIQNGYITVNPFVPQNVNPNSLDLRLGSWFIYAKEKAGSPGKIDYSVVSYYPDATDVIVPVTGVLAVTAESVGLKEHFTSELRGRSSTARKFITVGGGAGIGDVGFDAPWTVLLTASIPSSLRVGSKFAQMVFFSVDFVDDPYSGQYMTDQDLPLAMLPAAVRDDYSDHYAALVKHVKSDPKSIWAAWRDPDGTTRVSML